MTLQNNTYNALLSGTHALRVETGATCLISPTATRIRLGADSHRAGHPPRGGGTVKGLAQFTWPESPSGYIYLELAEPAENPYGRGFDLAGKKSIATNYPLSFCLKSQSTSLKQEGYRSATRSKPTSAPSPPPIPTADKLHGIARNHARLIVIDKETAFDASMLSQWLRVTEKGVLTVGKIGEDGISPRVNGLELLDGGQIRFADDGVGTLIAARFTHLFPNRNQWRATTLASDFADKLAGDAGTPCYVRTGYPDATDQTWQPADPDNLHMLSVGDPVLIAGEGPETDTLRLNYDGAYLYKDSPDSPRRAYQPRRAAQHGRVPLQGQSGLVQCGDAKHIRPQRQRQPLRAEGPGYPATL